MDAETAVRQLVRMRRVERALDDARARADAAVVREALEHEAGPTLRPAVAARLFGVSQPALSRRLERGDVASVVTREGARAVPVSAAVELLDAMEEGRLTLADVVRARRAAAAALDVDALLPRRRHGRPTSELRSLAYHRLVAQRLDARAIEQARRRIEEWVSAGSVDPRVATAWRDVLRRPAGAIARAIAADTARGHWLRQSSPFAGLVSEQERRRLLDAVA